MAEFKFKVIETRTIQCEYKIEANTLAQARALAEIGETDDEDEFEHTMEVINREIEGSANAGETA